MKKTVKDLLNKLRIKLGGGGLFYINGPETLPPPLSLKEEEEAILALSGENREEAKCLLIEHNLRLVVYIAKRFENTGICLEDLISIGTIGLVKAIGTFKAEKNIKQIIREGADV